MADAPCIQYRQTVHYADVEQRVHYVDMTVNLLGLSLVQTHVCNRLMCLNQIRKYFHNMCLNQIQKCLHDMETL